MSRFLLLFSLFPLLLAYPTQPLVRQNDIPSSPSCALGSSNQCEETVILTNGHATRSISTFFSLAGTDVSKAKKPLATVAEGSDENVITSAVVGAQSSQTEENDNVVYTTEIVFNGFPGAASLQITLEDSTGKIHTQLFKFYVVGVVLYEEQGDQPLILTGLNPKPTIVEALDDGAFGTTVKVKRYSGNPIITGVELDHIRFVVPDHPEILPWNPDDCPRAADKGSLRQTCSMAFSANFSEFSVRIEPGVEVKQEVRIQFLWEGIKDYQDDVNEEANVGGTNSDDLLKDDIITSILVGKQARDSGRSAGTGTLAGWKIGIIVIVSVVLVAAAITVVCCFGCGKRRSSKKPKPDVIGFKDKFQEIGFMRRVSTLRRGAHDIDDDDQCYVEEPPTPPDSEILMLENESRGHKRSGEGHIDGLIPIDRLNEDKSVEKLVLPGVVRGVELESSTEGASAFGYGTPSGENDITSYGRGMTSVPRDHFTKTRDRRSPRDRSSGSRRTDSERSRDPDYFRDSHERIRSLQRDRARIREMDRELERDRTAREQSEERMRPRAGEDEFMDSGPVIDERSNGMSRGRGGVDAAINRIRQLDLLNGPASRGLVGRNGEPIRRPDVEEGLDGDASEIPSVS